MWISGEPGTTSFSYHCEPVVPPSRRSPETPSTGAARTGGGGGTGRRGGNLNIYFNSLSYNQDWREYNQIQNADPSTPPQPCDNPHLDSSLDSSTPLFPNTDDGYEILESSFPDLLITHFVPSEHVTEGNFQTNHLVSELQVLPDHSPSELIFEKYDYYQSPPPDLMEGSDVLSTPPDLVASKSEFKMPSGYPPKKANRKRKSSKRTTAFNASYGNGSWPTIAEDEGFATEMPIYDGINPHERLKTKNKHRDRGPKCWEFLARLLLDSKTNPSLVCWENQKAYIFRITNKDKVVELWGNNTKDISYENFSRSLRYHYKTGGLRAVTESKLVYGFGELGISFLQKCCSARGA